MKIFMAPSILACNMLSVGAEMKRAKDSGADILHCDVMDGIYVPNISFGFDFIKAAGSVTDLPLDVHMMTAKPGAYISELKAAGAASVTVHHDTGDEKQVKDILKAIKAAGMRAAVALRPAFPAEDILPYVDFIDMALVMTVEPGFGGQKFMSDMISKIEKIRKYVPELDIQVDGGINAQTAALCASAGANVFVVGTASFGATDMKAAIDSIRSSASGEVM